jgi:hypothetical protein
MTDEAKGPIEEREFRDGMFVPGGKGGPGRPPLVPTEDDIRVAKNVARLGGTDLEIAVALGRDISVIKRWMVTHENFSLACKVGGDMADNRVERSLYQRAVGGTRAGYREAVTKDGDIVKLEWEEEVLGDVAAASRWLEARQRKDWGVKSVIQHEGELEVRNSRATLASVVARALKAKSQTPAPAPASEDDAS